MNIDNNEEASDDQNEEIIENKNPNLNTIGSTKEDNISSEKDNISNNISKEETSNKESTENEKTDVATLKKGFNAVIQELNVIDQIINSPDLVHFETEIDSTYEEERKLKAQLKAINEKRTLLYRKKKDCYKKIISMAEDF